MHLQLPLIAIEPLLISAAQRLAGTVGNPRDEAEWLMAELLGVERGSLRRHDGLAPDQAQKYERCLQRRLGGEPFAYITGTQPFRRLLLHVTPDVLVPRHDTETLVEWALQCLTRKRSSAVLDACTGSGCVALALADEAPGNRITGSDVSAAALAVARANAQRLRLDVQLVEADGLALPDAAARLDLITANPPYVAEQDPHLPALAHEPQLALVSGEDGLELIRRLIADAPCRLVEGGWLLLEHGFDQGEAVRTLLRGAGFSEVSTRRDLGGNERVSGGRWDRHG